MKDIIIRKSKVIFFSALIFAGIYYASRSFVRVDLAISFLVFLMLYGLATGK